MDERMNHPILWWVSGMVGSSLKCRGRDGCRKAQLTGIVFHGRSQWLSHVGQAIRRKVGDTGTIKFPTRQCRRASRVGLRNWPGRTRRPCCCPCLVVVVVVPKRKRCKQTRMYCSMVESNHAGRHTSLYVQVMRKGIAVQAMAHQTQTTPHMYRFVRHHPQTNLLT
jgi:hypothetical protein